MWVEGGLAGKHPYYMQVLYLYYTRPCAGRAHVHLPPLVCMYTPPPGHMVIEHNVLIYKTLVCIYTPLYVCPKPCGYINHMHTFVYTPCTINYINLCTHLLHQAKCLYNTHMYIPIHHCMYTPTPGQVLIQHTHVYTYTPLYVHTYTRPSPTHMYI